MEIHKPECQVGAHTFIGHLAVDTSIEGKKPAILIAHEWWGCNEYAQGRAEQLAGEGFVALAMDLYGGGEVASNPERAGELMNAARETDGAIEARFDAAYNFLAARDDVDVSNISVLGYCFGGAVALAMARAGKKLKVAASFHGTLQTETPMQSGTFDGRILVFNGADDPMVTPAMTQAFTEEMADNDSFSKTLAELKA